MCPRFFVFLAPVQAVALAFLLTVLALLSESFREIWHWAHSVLEPMSRSLSGPKRRPAQSFYSELSTVFRLNLSVAALFLLKLASMIVW